MYFAKVKNGVCGDFRKSILYKSLSLSFFFVVYSYFSLCIVILLA